MGVGHAMKMDGMQREYRKKNQSEARRERDMVVEGGTRGSGKEHDRKHTFVGCLLFLPSSSRTAPGETYCC